jgi:Leucine-rich repeat (LRR) protein
LDAICEANGVTEDHLLRRGAEQVRRVEMFMFNFPELRGLSLFTNLTSLSIMQQSLERIEGLEACAQLRHLWVVECRVRKMEGLGACSRLERLYLYGNAIRTVEGLDAAASSLNTLWLCDNDIEVVPDLGYLAALKELNLARNRVERCADATRECSKLVSLNVAANAIDSFKEVRGFGRLRALKELALSDPHWGANPVCRLSNYHTFALCAVPRLAVLDTTPIAEETKALAEATAMKKTMFYEMRARRARRRADQAVAAAAKGEAYVTRELDRARVALDRAIRHTEKTLADAEERRKTKDENGVFEASSTLRREPPNLRTVSNAENAEKKNENAFEPKKDDAIETGDTLTMGSSRTVLASLESAKTSVLVESEAMTRAFETCRSASRALADARDARARIELETGGNVRLEDGAPEAPWRDECAALARARFRGVGARLAGDDGPRVSGVRVVRVTRVHNRALRERFERAAARRADERLAAKRAEKRERRVERESAREKSARRGPSASDRGSSSSGASSSGSGSGSSESETTEEDASSEDASDEETRRGATEPSLTRAGGTEGRLGDAKARARRARRREKKEDASERTELFFVGVPDEAASRAVAELGVPRDATAKGAVVVHDSLDLADAARLAGARARMKKKNTFGASVPESEDPREAETGWMRGHAIVVRTRLGRAKTVETLGGSTVHASRFPGFDALTVVSPKAANQRSHYVFAKEDVVPEYVVEFQYDVVDADKSVNREVRAGDDVSKRRFREWTDPRFVSQRCESALLRLPFEARVVARPLARFLGAAAEAERARENAEDDDDETRAERDDASWAASAAFEVLSAAFGFEYDTHDSACRALDERLRRERDAMDGERTLRHRGDVAEFARRRAPRVGADAGALTRLDMHGVGLTRCENLDGCGNLRSLVLAFNNISKLENLENLTKLEHLDVSHNALRRIENLAGLSRLNTILLSDNKLFRLEDLNAMRAAAGSLRTLDLRANAMRENRAYAGLVLRRMTALQVLDGVKVTERDRRRAAASTTTLTAAMIKARATFDDEDVGFLASSRRLETSLNEKSRRRRPRRVVAPGPVADRPAARPAPARGPRAARERALDRPGAERDRAHGGPRRAGQPGKAEHGGEPRGAD